jgi:hypothetical protein
MAEGVHDTDTEEIEGGAEDWLPPLPAAPLALAPPPQAAVLTKTAHTIRVEKSGGWTLLPL